MGPLSKRQAHSPALNSCDLPSAPKARRALALVRRSGRHAALAVDRHLADALAGDLENEERLSRLALRVEDRRSGGAVVLRELLEQVLESPESAGAPC